MAFSAEEAAAIVGVTLTSATLSLIGSIVIVFTYLLLPRVQRFSYRIIAWLSLADTLSSLSYLIHEPTPFVSLEKPYSASCLISAGLSQLMDVATFLWTVAVSVTVYLVIIQRAPARTLRQAERLFHAICWGVPLLFLIIASATGSFGDAGTWCWITAEFPALRLILYYIPLMLCIIAVGVVASLIYRDIGESSSLKPNQKPAVLRRVFTFFAVFSLMRLFSIINRVHQLSLPPGAQPAFALSLLHSLFSPLQGFANSMVYGFNRLVLTEYAHLIARCRGQEAVSGHGESGQTDEHSGVGSNVSLTPSGELEAMDLDGGMMSNPIHTVQVQGPASARKLAAPTSPLAAELYGPVTHAALASRRSFCNPIDIDQETQRQSGGDDDSSSSSGSGSGSQK